MAAFRTPAGPVEIADGDIVLLVCRTEPRRDHMKMVFGIATVVEIGDAPVQHALKVETHLGPRYSADGKMSISKTSLTILECNILELTVLGVSGLVKRANILLTHADEWPDMGPDEKGIHPSFPTIKIVE